MTVDLTECRECGRFVDLLHGLCKYCRKDLPASLAEMAIHTWGVAQIDERFSGKTWGDWWRSKAIRLGFRAADVLKAEVEPAQATLFDDPSQQESLRDLGPEWDEFCEAANAWLGQQEKAA